MYRFQTLHTTLSFFSTVIKVGSRAHSLLDNERTGPVQEAQLWVLTWLWVLTYLLALGKEELENETM